MKTPVLLLTAALALTTVAVPSVSHADEPATVTCTSELDSPVQGNVLVPAGARCTITTTVSGNITVAANAALLVERSDIAGSMRIDGTAGAKTTVLLEKSRLGGDLSIDTATVAVMSSTVEGRTTSNPGQVGDSFIASSATFLDTVDVSVSHSYVHDATIKRGLVVRSAEYNHITDSTIEGNLISMHALIQTYVCGTRVTGSAWISRGGVVRIGPGTQNICKGHNHLGALTVSHSDHSVHVSHTTVDGNLAGWNNTKTPVIGADVSAGRTSGQFTGLLQSSAR